ncbi:MAG TPA: hypothetical protein VF950_18325, partial [Planctomycetota bacterium]
EPVPLFQGARPMNVTKHPVYFVTLRDGRRRAILWLGVCLPDAIAWAWTGLLGSPAELTIPLRSPLGLLPWCAAAALCFEADWRPRAFLALLAGGWIRLALGGPIYWAFPFSMARLENPLPLWSLAFLPVAEFLARRISARAPNRAA